ncbi:YycH family regulatory protein [Companilactobacillus jidongensis]|uniref:YycH family regulatory protein n=1 Tax=Companilactobacillus jidongensis TaxID=2486006 RepID=UPI000F78D574|nr:two-component system activity regulator YycH [Companilactobacillus jidongensis]
MKFSRLIVQILLVIAVITSIVLSFYIWTNTARYQAGRNIDVTTTDTDKNKIPIDQVISPTQVIWQDGTDQRLIYNNEENISMSIQKVMKDWNVGEPKQIFKKDGAKYQKMIQQENAVQLVYPTAISVKTLGYLLDSTALRQAKDYSFNRIIFTLKNKKDNYIYLANDSNYAVYRAKVKSASSEPILKLARKTNIDLKVRLNLLKHGVFTFYTEPIKMRTYSYVMSGKKDSEYTTALFDSNSDDLVTSQAENVYTYNYGETKRLISDHDKGELTFYDYTDTSVPKDRLSFFQRGYNKAVNLQNSVSNLRLYNADWSTKELTYREYVEGFPIFKKSQFGSIKIKFSRNGTTEYFLNKVLEVPVPSDQSATTLKSTTNILKGMEKAGYSPNDIQDIEVGYQWESEADNEDVIDLTPTYYIRIGSHWKTYSDWTNESAEEE